MLAQQLPCETLSDIWSRLHAGETFAFSGSEAHYLRTVAVSMDDDVTSLLLLKKLKLAAEFAPSAMPQGLVTMNSLAEFTFGQHRQRQCRIVHSAAPADELRLGIDSRLGAGLVGMRSGQSILWPDSDGLLKELCVLRVQCTAAPPHRKAA